MVGVACESISIGSPLKLMSCSTRSRNEVGGAVDSVDSISDSVRSRKRGGETMLSSIVL
jgi:hypothetical protein